MARHAPRKAEARLNQLTEHSRQERHRTPAGHAARHTVLRRHARLRRNNNDVALCSPSEKDRNAGDLRLAHSLLKVIFDDAAAAHAAARELRELGYSTLAPYPCERSRNGHHHLRTAR